MHASLCRFVSAALCHNVSQLLLPVFLCTGVAAPKRRRVDETVVAQEMPKWLEIKPTDDEKTKQKKRKLAKAYKSKARFARLDQQQKEKADAWKRFLAGKGKGTKK